MKPSVHTSGHSRWIRRSHRPDDLSGPNYRAHSKGESFPEKQIGEKGPEASETCVIRRRQEKGASVFEIYIISYNAGYTKYRGVKKPSFPGSGPFRRLLSLLGWLDRFFAFGTVMLFIAILLICFLRSFIIIVQSLAESFPALMSSTSPLDSDAAYSQRVFLFPNRRNRSYNTITLSVHWA